MTVNSRLLAPSKSSALTVTLKRLSPPSASGCDDHRLGTQKELDPTAGRRRAVQPGAEGEPLDGDRRQLPLAAGQRAGPAVVVADEAGHEGGGRAAVELLRGPHLLEAAAVHDRDAVGHHQGLGLVVGDVDEGGADLGLQGS